MSRIVFDDTAGNILERNKGGRGPRPGPRHMPLQEIMRVLPARQFEHPERHGFKSPIHK
jgi:hypothetical protein